MGNGQWRRPLSCAGFEILGVCGAAEGRECPSRPLAREHSRVEWFGFSAEVRVDALINRE